MKESIGSALLLNIALVFIGVISLILVSSVAYSKAFKVKNRIISIINEYDGNCDFNDINDSCFSKIETELSNMGYSSNISSECEGIGNNSSSNDGVTTFEITPIYKGDYHKYCVYRYDLCDYSMVDGRRICDPNSSKYYYYKVKTFMHFDIPLIGNFLEFSVSGDTKVFIDSIINYEG